MSLLTAFSISFVVHQSASGKLKHAPATLGFILESETLVCAWLKFFSMMTRERIDHKIDKAPFLEAQDRA